MKRSVVRYKAKPDKADENQQLIEAVFKELHATSPAGVRYAVLRLGDGSFVHIVASEADPNPIPGLTAFKAFQAGIKDRCLEPPQQSEAIVVANYRMLGE